MVPQAVEAVVAPMGKDRVVGNFIVAKIFPSIMMEMEHLKKFIRKPLMEDWLSKEGQIG